jgi:hypothetical protein
MWTAPSVLSWWFSATCSIETAGHVTTSQPTPWNGGHQLYNYSRTSLHFMEPKGSLPVHCLPVLSKIMVCDNRMINECGEVGGMKNWQENPEYLEETSPSATLSATNPTYPHLELNLSHCFQLTLTYWLILEVLSLWAYMTFSMKKKPFWWLSSSQGSRNTT